MTALGHELRRSVVVRATPERVFSFLSDSPRWAAWWGPGSTIDAQPAGTVYIRHPNGVEAKGAVVEVHPGRRIGFTFGYVSGTPIPVGSSRIKSIWGPMRAARDCTCSINSSTRPLAMRTCRDGGFSYRC